jgi:DNA polymerase-1
MRSTIKFCRKNGYVNNIFGRRIHLKGINDKNFSVRSFQERAAINAPIQSSAADIIRLAMIKLHNQINLKKIYDAQMLLQIHDELVFECLKNNQSAVEKAIKKTMESVSSSEHHIFTIPLEVNINSGNSWEEAH